MATYTSKFAHVQGGDYMIVEASGRTARSIFASGQATDSAGIITQTGAANTIADGSLYLSTVAGAGLAFVKQNGAWVNVQL